MIFSKAMYFGEHAAERKHYILENLRQGRVQFGAYVITEGKNSNLYEIHQASWLLNPKVDSSKLEILGIGYGYEDTLRLLQRMIEERFLK